MQFCFLMLQKESIKLRAVEPEDIDFLFHLENKPELWHVSQTLVPFARFDMEQYVFSLNKQDPFVAGQVRFIIELTQDDDPKVIGAIDLFALDAINRRGGVGIVLLESYRGKSFAGMALDILIDYGFNFLNLHQLFCNIESANEASLKLFRRRGFETAGVKKEWKRKNGVWVDENLLQLIAKD